MHIFLENQFYIYELWCIVSITTKTKGKENEKHQGDEDERS